MAEALCLDCKHNGCSQGTDRVAGAEGKVAYCNLELAKVLLPDVLPNRVIKTLSGNKVKNGHFLG